MSAQPDESIVKEDQEEEGKEVLFHPLYPLPPPAFPPPVFGDKRDFEKKLRSQERETPGFIGCTFEKLFPDLFPASDTPQGGEGEGGGEGEEKGEEEGELGEKEDEESPPFEAPPDPLDAQEKEEEAPPGHLLVPPPDDHGALDARRRRREEQRELNRRFSEFLLFLESKRQTLKKDAEAREEDDQEAKREMEEGFGLSWRSDYPVHSLFPSPSMEGWRELWKKLHQGQEVEEERKGGRGSVPTLGESKSGKRRKKTEDPNAVPALSGTDLIRLSQAYSDQQAWLDPSVLTQEHEIKKQVLLGVVSSHHNLVSISKPAEPHYLALTYCLRKRRREKGGRQEKEKEKGGKKGKE